MTAAVSGTALTAWCGWCGVVFDPAAVLGADAVHGVLHCPRCARPFSPSYAATVVGLLRSMLAGTARPQDLVALVDTAPHLHLELP